MEVLLNVNNSTLTSTISVYHRQGYFKTIFPSDEGNTRPYLENISLGSLYNVMFPLGFVLGKQYICINIEGIFFNASPKIIQQLYNFTSI